ncbi:MAG: HNH endonuclease [Ruminococcaceae bacterium]|nr:HNH endonuclease [Oscillospiraceae bacterium]
MKLPYSDSINTGYLARLFDNTSECYKLFWFKAIVTAVGNDKQILTYEELIDKMIADAWYMVTEYHLSLGPKDSLQAVIELMNSRNPELKSSEKESVIIDYLANVNDKEILSKKHTLTYNVPYRLQAPFLTDLKGKAWNIPTADLAARINQGDKLIYYFEAINGLASRIIVNDEWADYIKKNREIILGWIEYHMIHYLQKRNPSVPGIADKLYPPQERKLEKVKKYWKMVLSVEPVREIYNNQMLTDKDISIDHFVPWSYVAHDEFWNLSPTTRSINSSKSNNLPNWELYFPRLVRLEYQSYKLMWKYDIILKEFNKCAKEHINNIDIQERLYKEGLSCDEFTKQLETVIRPIFNAAHECGFNWNWEYKDQII